MGPLISAEYAKDTESKVHEILSRYKTNITPIMAGEFRFRTQDRILYLSIMILFDILPICMLNKSENPLFGQSVHSRALLDGISRRLLVKDLEGKDPVLPTYDMLRTMIETDPNILAMQFLPYVWVESSDGSGNIHVRHSEGPNLSFTRDHLLRMSYGDLQQRAQDMRVRSSDQYINIGITSPVTYREENGEEVVRYLGLMDFRLPAHVKGNQALLTEKIRSQSNHQFAEGFLINSGASFQFIASTLFQSKDQLLEFYGNFLNLEIPPSQSPTGKLIVFADRRFIGHTLKHKGVANLRLTSSSQKPNVPHVVGVVGK